MNKWAIAAKAMRVIRSCETIEQLKVAEKYCERVKQLVPEKDRGFLPTFTWLIQDKQKLIEEKEAMGLCDELDKTIVNYEKR